MTARCGLAAEVAARRAISADLGARAHDEAKFTITVVMGIDSYSSIETKKSH
jgi:hypothetical protein